MDGLSNSISGAITTINDLNNVKIPERSSRKAVSGSNIDNAVVRNLIAKISNSSKKDDSREVQLQVNDRVLASYNGIKQKYPGVVIKKNGDNTYKIRFDEYQEYTYDDVIHEDTSALNLKKKYDKFPLQYPEFRTNYHEYHY